MLRFQYSAYLSALALLPLLVALFVAMLYWRRKKLDKIGTASLVKQQILGYIPARQTLKFILLGSALLLIIIGCANLQKGGTTETVQRKGVDVMIALDVSKSMLAKDMQPDRLTRAKQLIARLTDKMSSDRVGLVIFAGRSYLQVPLTVDYSTLKLLLQTVSPDMVPTQGTVIGDAIELSNKSFSSKERKFKSIILISDGEDHDESAISKVKEASDGGAIVHTVGIGSPQGAQLFDEATKAPKLDEKGDPLITKLNETELKNIAAAGNGTYTLLGNTDAAANKLIEEIDGMEQRNLGSVVYANYISYFQYFLLAALLLILVEWLLPGASKPVKKIAIAKTGKAALLLLLALFFMAENLFAQGSKKLIASGNKLYAAGNYKDAAVQYGKALQKDTANLSKGAYNLGNALYQQKQIEPARKAYEAAAKKTTDKTANAGANYNIGNTYMSEKKWQEAIDAYKKTLRNNPQDVDAKYNLSYAQQMLKKEGGGGKDKNKDKKEEQKKEDEKKEQEKKEQQKKEGEQDKKDGQPKEGEDKKEEEQKPQSQPSKLTEKQAEQLLNALQQEEKKLQEKNKKKHGSPVKVEKDW